MPVKRKKRTKVGIDEFLPEVRKETLFTRISKVNKKYLERRGKKLNISLSVYINYLLTKDRKDVS